MAVITMTREMGSLGNRVAQEVAKRLGLRLVYQELVHGVAERMHMRPSSVGRFVEGEASFVERFFIDSRRMGLCTAEELLELAMEGNVLIRGWGASYVLKPVAHAMHVRVRASMEDRVQNMMKRMETLDPRTWRHEIEASDRQHSEVVERMYGTNSWQDPAHYDVVLDTSVTSVEACVEGVLAASDAPRFRETAESRQALADALLAAKLRNALEAGLNLRLRVAACAGNVRVEGIVDSDAKREALQAVIARFPGVTRVDTQVRVMKEAAHYIAE